MFTIKWVIFTFFLLNTFTFFHQKKKVNRKKNGKSKLFRWKTQKFSKLRKTGREHKKLNEKVVIPCHWVSFAFKFLQFLPKGDEKLFILLFQLTFSLMFTLNAQKYDYFHIYCLRSCDCHQKLIEKLHNNFSFTSFFLYFMFLPKTISCSALFRLSTLCVFYL